MVITHLKADGAFYHPLCMHDVTNNHTLHTLGFRAAQFPDFVAQNDKAEVLCRLIEQHRTDYLLAHAGGECRAQAHPKLKQLAPELRPAVGDFVPYVLGQQFFHELLPRFSALKRAAAGERYAEQILAANIDLAFIVCGLDRDFSARRIERYLALVRGCGVDAVVILSKADASPDAIQQQGELRERLSGERIYAMDTRNLADAMQLAAELPAGHTGVLLGSSGAGKSTLSNTLAGTMLMSTGDVRKRDGRGKHTTVHRALLRLPWGACIIDCPGLREIKLTADDATTVASFDDIEEFALQCKFRDCQHEREPGCAVMAAIASELLSMDRYFSYKKLCGELRQQSAKLQTYAHQKNQRR